jgi:tetratricopeptide (TPR) repeat protein
MESTDPQPPEPTFLDPQDLIERSQPAPRAGRLGYGVGLFLLVILLSTFAGGQSPQAQSAVRMIGGLTMMLVIAGMGVFTWYTVHRQREEQRRVDAIDELLQLRRWQEAGMMLQSLLSMPTRTPQARVQALIYLAAVLGRYHRFADAITVQEHLLENIPLDAGTAYGIALGRAMAMLHEDRLVDADRAISELRRAEGSGESGGLALVEMYRDVKTGHPGEAIETFTTKLPVIKKQLGQRVADAWALLAKAYDMVGHEDRAREAYANATVLSPIAEISRRYAEVASLSGKYTPAAAPAE